MNNKNNIVVNISQLTVRFGNEIVLNNINLQFYKQQIAGIVGRNGSGKTVLFKCICGFLKPTSGEVRVFNNIIGKDCDFAPDTGMIIETPGFLPHETGLENLRWLSKMRTKLQDNELKTILSIVGLDPTSKKKVSKYSLGMRQRLGIAQAIMENPKLLVLDEPMNGLDNQGVEEIRELLLKLRYNGATIILASHNTQDIEALCDTVHQMDKGVLTTL